MSDGPLKNLDVLREQAGDALEHGRADLVVAKDKWRRGDYLGAIKTATYGVVAEWYQHAWRWILYRDTALLVAAIYLLWKGYRVVPLG